MAEQEKQPIRTRPPTPEETALNEWFAEQEKDPSKTLEEAAKQIIHLVSALYAVVFGILAFADNPAYLGLLMVRLSGTVVVLTYLIALISALFVVMPRRYTYASASQNQRQIVFDKIIGRKANLLRIAWISFGLASIALAVLLLSILFYF